MSPAVRNFFIVVLKTAFGLFAAFNALLGLIAGFLVLVFQDNLSPHQLWGYVVFALMALYAVTSVWALIRWLRKFDRKAACAVVASVGLFGLTQLISAFADVQGLYH